jgi:hypothetical protein
MKDQIGYFEVSPVEKFAKESCVFWLKFLVRNLKGCGSGLDEHFEPIPSSYNQLNIKMLDDFIIPMIKKELGV